MIIVVIAGGEGSRLWPLSTPSHPKHLLSLVDDNSLLQNTILRVKDIADNIYIIPERSHVAEVKKQLPEYAKNIILEPGRRGTAHCILYALAQLKPKIASDEVVVFLHADHHIQDKRSFVKTIEVASNVAKNMKRLALIGISPTYPATGFGYIKLGSKINKINNLDVYEVDRFVEKPDQPTADKYYESKQYLWNLGLFAATIDTFENEIKNNNTDLWDRYNALLQADADHKYLDFPNEPIDTALIEKIDDLLVIPGEFDWADIGSFADLYTILNDGKPNVHKGKVYDIDSKNSLVIAGDKPIVTIGIDDLIVIDSDEGILICPKDKCQLVKEGIKKLKESN
jgi:mannose-1-phosphate guanylyltransferase/mannose-6-phosphate isomerase